ncbi:dsDNA nuclease domain-containing protein [Pseudomonas sp. JDS28PS106]|uniref:dsDNA nuclease domain-containing protein n=1 Tax=Pseudomonas sp. JDS28PS106 TaxID=2497235 RepID=UPI002FD6E13B
MKLSDVKARELNGRDTIHRFKAQFRAASLECLALLDSNTIERVFCDFHEDYVVKLVDKTGIRYRFVQVKTKTKQNHLYSPLEIFGIKKKPKNAAHDLANSFAGKLLLHIESFGDACLSVVICTNVNFDDDVEALIDDASSGTLSSKITPTLINETKALIPSLSTKTDNEVLAFLAHLELDPRNQILNEEDDSFLSNAHSKIYKYSEINLHPKEIQKIIIQLLSLIEDKSSYELKGTITESALNDKASVAIDDLLDILALSRSAYHVLKEGGDPNAVKSVSILQRMLQRNNFKEDTINSFAAFKSQWETWYRINRHSIQEFTLLKMQSKIGELAHKLSSGIVDMDTVTSAVENLRTELSTISGRADLEDGLVFGAVLSEMVREELV